MKSQTAYHGAGQKAITEVLEVLVLAFVLGRQESDNTGPIASDSWPSRRKLRRDQVGFLLELLLVRVVADYRMHLVFDWLVAD